MTTRFYCALGVYAVLALLAAFTLDGKLRAAVWIFLGGLTVKTCIAYRAGWYALPAADQRLPPAPFCNVPLFQAAMFQSETRSILEHLSPPFLIENKTFNSKN